MDSRWTKGYEGEAKAQRVKEVLSYNTGFRELLTLAKALKKNPVRDYNPGWAEKQIAVNEYNAALEDLINLIKHAEN